MKRRGFLTGTAAAATAVGALAPGWLRRAFAQDAATGGDGGEPTAATPADEGAELLAAYRRARRAGKPLLVIVVPPDGASGRSWERGHLWGELIGHGGDEALALLSLVELACAPPSAVRRLAPSSSPEEAIAVLLTTDRVPAQVATIAPELPEWVDLGWGNQAPTIDEVIDTRIARLTEALRDAIVPSPRHLAALVAASSRRSNAAERARIAEAARTGGALPAAVADRGAAVLFEAMSRTTDATLATSLRRMLAGAASARLWDQPPTGAATRWAHDSPCGDGDYERTPSDQERERRERAAWEREERERRARGEPARPRVIRVGYACGMGFVPERSARFLRFYAVRPRGRP